MSTPAMIGASAILSDDSLYRYELFRWWRRDTTPLTFIMLNPSTADATLDDPTIRRCVSFAEREGYGALYVYNLFAYRATNPHELNTVVDAIGPINNAMLSANLWIAKQCDLPVVAAWGVGGGKRAEQVKAMAKEEGVSLKCLGRTKDGHPRHPLYVPGDAPLIDLEP